MALDGINVWCCVNHVRGNTGGNHFFLSFTAKGLSTRVTDRMGRTKSVARVYADVNARLGPSWYEYGTIAASTSSLCLQSLSLLDNLQVQWGSQDHYEIVRKVGRGKYSEVRDFLFT